MSVETFIGWRYLKARRKQTFISMSTWISLVGISLGVAALIVVLAVLSGTEEDLKRRILGIESHMVVLRYGQPMEQYQELVPQIQAIEGVTSVEPFIYSQVMFTAAGGVSGAILRGVDPVLTAASGYLSRILKQGRWSDLEMKTDRPVKLAPTVIMGATLARHLKIRVGDTVRMMSPEASATSGGGRKPRIRNLEVVGIFEMGMNQFDANLAYVSIRQAQDFLNIGPSVTGLAVRVADIYRADAVRGAGAGRDRGETFDRVDSAGLLFARLRCADAAGRIRHPGCAAEDQHYQCPPRGDPDGQRPAADRIRHLHPQSRYAQYRLFHLIKS